MKPKDNIFRTACTRTKKNNNPGTAFFIFAFLTLYFLPQLSGIYLNDVRANIKNKKRREKLTC